MPLDGGALVQLLGELGPQIALSLIVPFLLLMAMAILGNIVQHSPVWSVEPLTPKFSKVSPIAGFKRLFSSESLMNFAKGLLKISLIGVLMVIILMPQRDRLDAVMFTDLSQFLPMVLDLAVALLLASTAVMVVIGVADYLYQRHRWFEKQKMSVKELRDEYKQQEGDPMVKAKLRQVHMERSRRRMMAAVPTATVVVTNPTHYAVALKYENGMGAPLCVAKGVDALALSIRQVAREHEVTIVENPPLARALHASVDIDQTIPHEHFEAVAKVIGFVIRMRERRAARG